MQTFVIVFEAIIIIGLSIFIFREWMRKRELMKQANLIKKRRMDLDDIEIDGDRKDSMAALAER